jgi:hypothetical protein
VTYQKENPIMVEYTTLDDLRGFNREVISEQRATILKRAAERSPSGSTFLSHSTKDVEFLPGLIRLLESHGAKVYVDKKDDKIPPYTSRETAKVLRSRISQCKKFILFATKKSKDSLWMPWELGISDGVKQSQNTAIFPGLDTASDTEWVEREYLGVYDRVVWGNIQGEPNQVWMVWNQENNIATTLSKWLQSD